MKKIKIIATIIFLMFLFSKKTLAANDITDIENAFLEALNTNYGTEATVNSGNFNYVVDFLTFWNNEDYQSKKLIMYIEDNTRIDYALVDSYTITDNYISYSYYRRMSYFYSGTFAGRFSTLGSNGNTNNNTYQNFMDFGDLNTFMNPIDYENYVYDPTIYVPNIKAVYTGNNPSQAASNYSIPVEFTIDNGAGLEYGIQIQYKFWMPKLIKFIYSDGGAVNYAYTNYSGHFNELYEMGSGETISAAENGEKEYLTFNLLDNINDWVNFHSSVMLTQTYESNVSDYSSSQSAYARFNKNALKMGNRLELWVRYYYVADGVVYAGDWRHWISEAPQEQDLVQSVQYVTGATVSANSNQVNPSDQEISQELESPTSVLPSYQNVQVTVINQVPNNMNYPTIASYQNDNMLVDTMNNATKIMNWLNGEGEFAQSGMNGASNGGFGAFLGASFGFIPWYIWAVIAVGFGFSIVIMILKVL